MSGDALHAEVEARRRVYEVSARATAAAFVRMAGAAALLQGSPLGDMQTNRLGLPLKAECIGIASLQELIAAEADRLRQLP